MGGEEVKGSDLRRVTVTAQLPSAPHFPGVSTQLSSPSPFLPTLCSSLSTRLLGTYAARLVVRSKGRGDIPFPCLPWNDSVDEQRDVRWGGSDVLEQAGEG